MINRFFGFAIAALAALTVEPRVMANIPSSICPDPALGETTLDCPWAGLSRELSDLPPGEAPEKFLKKRAPNLYEQIHSEYDRLPSERSSKRWHSLWGWSINFDELAHGIIVDPAILKVLYSISGIPAPSLGPGAPDN